ncbi:MAG: zinc ribbon domain-containing protein [Methanomassiliicoccales archaeon]|jgi:hypothetical protein
MANCPKCGFANPGVFRHCGMCGTELPDPRLETVFGVTFTVDEDEPYLIFQSWWDDTLRTVSKEKYQLNLIMGAVAGALIFLAFIPLVGLLQSTVIILIAAIVTSTMNYLTFRKARRRALEERQKGLE